MGFLIAALMVAVPLSAAITGPVGVSGGRVVGVVGNDRAVAVFKGLPFAAPPVGDLRWRAPKSVAAWKGVRKAEQFGNSCIQNVASERKPWTYEFMSHTPVSEDCLYLNVWTAAKSARDRRPVYVYIHGGANTEGSGAVPVYDGEGLAKKGIVVVTVNYRLGVFGFMAHPELTKESDVRASGNYALLDLVAALEWVKENIAAFGGDPARVTVGGQSAGASNTHALVASPLAKGLFRGAVAESGSSVRSMGARPLADGEQLGVKFAAAKGAKSLSEMRALSSEQLMAPVTPPIRFGAVVDGYFLKDAGAIESDVPTLTGCNKHEGGAVPHPEAVTKPDYAEMTDEFVRLYGGNGNDAAWDRARVSMYLWAVNRSRTAKTQAFTYFWDHALPGPDVDKYGAFHTSEVPYFFDSLGKSDRDFVDMDRKIADRMSGYLVSFVTTGKPGWASVGEKAAMTMELGDRNEMIPVAGSAEKLAFWEKWFARR